ncbi:putative GNAT family acetyltransferase [Xylariomycetidae sp. FL0641]|nr:putative GNAT family acetyltransferase [Xylariomycetidae sp. FL0641]
MSTQGPFDPFLSERLVYRAVEDTAADENFVHHIQRDAEAQSGSSYGLLRPESIKASNEFKTRIAEHSLLGAMVCLRDATGAAAAGERIGILVLKANPPALAPHRWSEISIDVAAAHRGRGYGAETLRWAQWWAFQMAGLHRLQLRAFAFNAGAARLYARLGFREEGRLREHMWFNGRWHDIVIFGILEHEWRDGQKTKLKEGCEE